MNLNVIRIINRGNYWNYDMRFLKVIKLQEKIKRLKIYNTYNVKVNVTFLCKIKLAEILSVV
jgi:hypothetical protein